MAIDNGSDMRRRYLFSSGKTQSVVSQVYQESSKINISPSIVSMAIDNGSDMRRRYLFSSGKTQSVVSQVYQFKGIL